LLESLCARLGHTGEGATALPTIHLNAVPALTTWAISVFRKFRRHAHRDSNPMETTASVLLPAQRALAGMVSSAPLAHRIGVLSSDPSVPRFSRRGQLSMHTNQLESRRRGRRRQITVSYVRCVSQSILQNRDVRVSLPSALFIPVFILPMPQNHTSH